jgi:prepilin-type N-terminal cleavage/methylation domain-containing protein
MLSATHTNLQCNEGFTLVELMIATAILGILAALAVPSFMTYRDEADVAASLSSGIRGALAAAAATDPYNSYPANEQISKPSDLNQYGANLRDEAFASFTYNKLEGEESYKVGIVTFGGKEVCVRPEGITKAKCE